MPDPKTIRLTDFTQGIQTTDRLDYAPNAVRAGSNVDLGKKVRTRGGINTVDSVGLPANSEIMAIEQVYFPTNEKSFLVAQVKYPYIAAEEEITVTPTSYYENIVGLLGFASSEGSSGNFAIDDLFVSIDGTTILDMDFADLDSSAEYFGVGVDADMHYLPETPSPGYGIQAGQYVFSCYSPTIIFPDYDQTSIDALLASASTILINFKLTKKFDSTAGYGGQYQSLITYGHGDGAECLSLGYTWNGTGDDEEIWFYTKDKTATIDIQFLEENVQRSFYLAITDDTYYLSETGLTSGYSYALYALPDTLPDTGA